VEKIEGVKLLAGRVDDFLGQGNDLPDVPYQRSLTCDQSLLQSSLPSGGGGSSPGRIRELGPAQDSGAIGSALARPFGPVARKDAIVECT
jgi:hypothetical protein